MEDSVASALPQPSPLLWLLALLIAGLSGHILVAALRHARHVIGHGSAWWPRTSGALAVACGATAVGGLIVTSQALAYPVGFDLGLLGWAAASALAGAAAAVLVLAHRSSLPWLVAAATMIAAGTVGAATFTVVAAGLLPGLDWQAPLLAVAVAAAAAMTGGGLWVGIAGPGRAGPNRRIWRIIAGVLVGLALVVADELVLAAGDMTTQIASRHRDDWPALWLTLTCAVAAPALLAALALDLHLRETKLQLRLGEAAGRGRSRRRRERLTPLR